VSDLLLPVKLRKPDTNPRPVYISLSTKPARIAFISETLKRIDLETYDVKVILNLPILYGADREPYVIPDELYSNPRVFIKRLPEDLGPISKVLPTFKFVTDRRAVVVSIDDDTVYPRDVVNRLMQAMQVVDYRAVVAICGVNISSWGLDTSCDYPGGKCAPFSTNMTPNAKPLMIQLPEDKVPRALTPIEAIKGFTGVAYPMEIISPEIFDDMRNWRKMRALDADLTRGFPEESCFASDDYVISAALHRGGVQRYRISISDDCREGLSQFEFGFMGDALQMKDGGHYAKYFACARGIDHVLHSIPQGAATVYNQPRVENWIDRNFKDCKPPKLAAKTVSNDKNKALDLRWKKDWYAAGHVANTSICWTDYNMEERRQWRCPFPIEWPDQEPKPVYTADGARIFPIQYAFQHNRMTRELREVTKDFSVIWPVQAKSRDDTRRGYLFDTEEKYYNEYGTSLFAYTYRKGKRYMTRVRIKCIILLP
jgi:hypothetical protein